MQTLLQDLRFGLRMLAKNPGFTAVAMLTLALGIGGTTAIFSVVYGAVLKPFPYRDSDRLVMLTLHDVEQGRLTGVAWVSASELRAYREQNHVFDEVIGGSPMEVVLTGSEIPEIFWALAVTGNAFRVLGVPPMIGRLITAEDCRAGAPPVVLLSHEVWQAHFGGDPGIVGRTLILNQQPTTVIGVMPPRFGWQRGEIWLPASVISSEPTDREYLFTMVGRLKQGVSLDQANADVGVLAKRLARIYPKDYSPETTVRVATLVDPWFLGAGKTFYILLGAVGVLLLIACGNVSNLLLARATGREREFAVRAALGASRGRLVRQLLIENLLLALGGAILGCLAAWNGLGSLMAIIPVVPETAVIRINGLVLLFTLGTAIFSTLLFGLVPTLLAVRKDLQAQLKASARGAGESRGHHRMRQVLVVSEVALSLVLLTGAGMLIRSYFALRYIDLGYDPDHVMVAGAFLPPNQYKTPEQRNLFNMEALRRVRALPGVVSAALGGPAPNWAIPATVEIEGKPSSDNRRVRLRFAGDGFFETMRIRMLRGRGISEEDVVQGRRVAVVSQTLVTSYFGNANPLGRQIKLVASQSVPPAMKQTGFEIIGEVADTRYIGDEDGGPTVEPTMFVPFSIGGIGVGVAVRTIGDPVNLFKPVRETYAAIDKELPVHPHVLRDIIKGTWFTEPQFVMTMLVAFASLGLTLVCIGVYSVLSYSVSQRTNEIGIRMALGAQVSEVRRMVMMSGLRWLAVGIGIGVLASIALAKILQNRIWGIKSADPLTLVAVSLLLTLVGLAACYFPARRATKVDPMVALRYE
jgi:putative ABC transport system permease protein